MTMESGIVREGNSQKLRNTGWGGRIRRTRIRGRRAAVDAGVLALIAVLLGPHALRLIRATVLPV